MNHKQSCIRETLTLSVYADSTNPMKSRLFQIFLHICALFSHLIAIFVTFGFFLALFVINKSCVTFHKSHFTCQLSHVTFHLSLRPTSTDLPLLTLPLSTLDRFLIKKKTLVNYKQKIFKIVVSFERIMQFWCSSRFRILRTIYTHYILWSVFNLFMSSNMWLHILHW